MPTMCCFCAPPHLVNDYGEVEDLGFRLPDVRDSFDLFDEDDEIVGSITVRIVRSWGPCDCGSDESVMTGHTWNVSGPDCSINVPSHTDVEAVVMAIWPNARSPRRDYAWESEAGLRRAEGWGC